MTPTIDRAPLLEARGVAVRFGGLVALDGVDLVVDRSSIAGLVGPNGAGKTTLFGVLSGLRRPTDGTVAMGERDITLASPQARCRLGMARTFQRPELFAELTVRQHLVVAHRAGRRPQFLRDLLRGQPRPDPAEDRLVGALLEDLDLVEVADVVASALPLGTARRVEVGRALATGPAVVLLDEPSSGLDDHETARLAVTLRRARDERGVAFVLVEHDVDLVLGLADRVTVLDFGRVIAEGPPAAIRADAAVQAAYLGAVTPL